MSQTNISGKIAQWESVINANLFIVGSAVIGATRMVEWVKGPLTTEGMLLASLLNGVATISGSALAKKYQLNESYYHGMIAVGSLAIGSIATPYIASTFLANTAIQISFQGALAVGAVNLTIRATTYTLYKLYQHFSQTPVVVPPVIPPKTINAPQDVQKLSVAELAQWKADLEKNSNEKWAKLPISIQMAFNKEWKAKGPGTIHFTSLIQPTPFSDEELDIIEAAHNDDRTKEYFLFLYANRRSPTLGNYSEEELSLIPIPQVKGDVDHLAKEQIKWHHHSLCLNSAQPLQDEVRIALANHFFTHNLKCPGQNFSIPIPETRDIDAVHAHQLSWYFYDFTINKNKWKSLSFTQQAEFNTRFLVELAKGLLLYPKQLTDIEGANADLIRTLHAQYQKTPSLWVRLPLEIGVILNEKFNCKLFKAIYSLNALFLPQSATEIGNLKKHELKHYHEAFTKNEILETRFTPEQYQAFQLKFIDCKLPEVAVVDRIASTYVPTWKKVATLGLCICIIALPLLAIFGVPFLGRNSEESQNDPCMGDQCPPASPVTSDIPTQPLPPSSGNAPFAFEGPVYQGQTSSELPIDNSTIQPSPFLNQGTFSKLKHRDLQQIVLPSDISHGIPHFPNEISPDAVNCLAEPFEQTSPKLHIDNSSIQPSTFVNQGTFSKSDEYPQELNLLAIQANSDKQQNKNGVIQGKLENQVSINKFSDHSNFSFQQNPICGLNDELQNQNMGGVQTRNEQDNAAYSGQNLIYSGLGLIAGIFTIGGIAKCLLGKKEKERKIKTPVIKNPIPIEESPKPPVDSIPSKMKNYYESLWQNQPILPPEQVLLDKNPLLLEKSEFKEQYFGIISDSKFKSNQNPSTITFHNTVFNEIFSKDDLAKLANYLCFHILVPFYSEKYPEIELQIVKGDIPLTEKDLKLANTIHIAENNMNNAIYVTFQIQYGKDETKEITIILQPANKMLIEQWCSGNETEHPTWIPYSFFYDLDTKMQKPKQLDTIQARALSNIRYTQGAVSPRDILLDTEPVLISKAKPTAIYTSQIDPSNLISQYFVGSYFGLISRSKFQSNKMIPQITQPLTIKLDEKESFSENIILRLVSYVDFNIIGPFISKLNKSAKRFYFIENMQDATITISCDFFVEGNKQEITVTLPQLDRALINKWCNEEETDCPEFLAYSLIHHLGKVNRPDLTVTDAERDLLGEELRQYVTKKDAENVLLEASTFGDVRSTPPKSQLIDIEPCLTSITDEGKKLHFRGFISRSRYKSYETLGLSQQSSFTKLAIIGQLLRIPVENQGAKTEIYKLAEYVYLHIFEPFFYDQLQGDDRQIIVENLSFRVNPDGSITIGCNYTDPKESKRITFRLSKTDWLDFKNWCTIERLRCLPCIEYSLTYEGKDINQETATKPKQLDAKTAGGLKEFLELLKEEPKTTHRAPEEILDTEPVLLKQPKTTEIYFGDTKELISNHVEEHYFGMFSSESFAWNSFCYETLPCKIEIEINDIESISKADIFYVTNYVFHEIIHPFISKEKGKNGLPAIITNLSFKENGGLFAIHCIYILNSNRLELTVTFESMDKTVISKCCELREEPQYIPYSLIKHIGKAYYRGLFFTESQLFELDEKFNKHFQKHEPPCATILDLAPYSGDADNYCGLISRSRFKSDNNLLKHPILSKFKQVEHPKETVNKLVAYIYTNIFEPFFSDKLTSEGGIIINDLLFGLKAGNNAGIIIKCSCGNQDSKMTLVFKLSLEDWTSVCNWCGEKDASDCANYIDYTLGYEIEEEIAKPQDVNNKPKKAANRGNQEKPPVITIDLESNL